MRKIHLFIGLLLFLFVQVSANNRTEKRSIDTFDAISLRVSANLFVEQGDEPSIEITASENTLKKIIVEIVNEKMIIRFSIEDRLFNNFDPGKIVITVATPTINQLSILGSGNIIAEGLIKTYALDLNISGSGDIRLSNVACDNLDAQISGSGDITVSGDDPIHEFNVSIAGSGDVIAYELQAENCEIIIAGSGDCDVFVTDFIDAKIYGSGDIIYRGSPKVKSSIAGSGKIHNF